MSALVEYGATQDEGGWLPHVWLNGEEQGLTWAPDATARAADRDRAIYVATDAAISLAEAYLGKGGVEIRLRVEPATPPVLGPESTLAELSALVAERGSPDLRITRTATSKTWIVTVGFGGNLASVHSGATLIDALADALASTQDAGGSAVSP